ncbi:MAG: 50S ribosomal protein L13 [Chlamydiae bacterium RIFCSPHIGHO2_12_FULL_27_8]|nr:MAG: 50S ribosomal protein L13 [Chlamydiae bacterium RIFCSPHIGHO2_12_FULL_27_8]OGN64756.1 MAG: 50S ribosomal protein L13 [Chlamydiae bacterium RIFCSPLOWO2_01_FULL_28_7]
MDITKFVHKAEALTEKKYFLFDANGKTLGRFATEISKILRGKHKPNYTPNVDTGDFVVVVNANKIKVTGTKEARKVYRYHTGWVGGLKEVPYRVMLKKNPEEIIYRAVKGMMPVKSKLARQQLKKLKIFKNEDHNLQAQKPLVVNI